MRYFREGFLSKDGKRLRFPGLGTDVILVEEPPPPPPGLSSSFLTRARGFSIYSTGGGDRDALVYGRDMPTLATAGALDRSLIAANPINGFTLLNGAGSTVNDPIVISDKWFRGGVKVTGGWYDFHNCQLNGHPTTVGPLLDVQGSAIGRVRVFDSDMWAQNPQWNTPAVYGWRTELYRVYVRACTDGYAHVGIGRNGTNNTGGGTDVLTGAAVAIGDNYTGIKQGVRIKGSIFELMAYKSPDPGAAGGLTDNSSHGDGVLQTRGGDDIDVQGNLALLYCDPSIGEGGFHPAIRMPSNTLVKGQKYSTATNRMLGFISAIQCSPVHGKFSNFKFRDNWVAGGAVIINFAGHTSTGPLGGIEVTGNRVDQDHRTGATAYWLANPALPLTLAGNVVMLVDKTGRPLADRDFARATDTFTVTTTAANNRTNGA